MLTRHRHPNGVVTYQSSRLSRLRVPHAFTTRLGGVSGPAGADLDLADALQTVRGPPGPKHAPGAATHWDRVQQAIGCGQHAHFALHQVHGGSVHIVDGPGATESKADAVITGTPKLLLAIRIADCVPVLLAGPVGDAGPRVIGAIHAGWRGIVASVVTATLQAIDARFGVAARQIAVAVGPCIGAAAYEVGIEVAEAFDRVGLRDTVYTAAGARPHVDLRAAVITQLRALGVHGDQIDTTDRCTHRDREEFFSHRRGDVGRTAAVVGMPGGECGGV